MSLSRIRFLAVVIALLAGAAAQAAASQPGGVTFKFFTGSDGTKPDLISRQVAYAPGTATYGSIKAWSGMTANLGFDVSSTESNDLFGFSASSAGDVDGDGYDDIVVGAPLSNAGGSASGRVYVYSALSGQLLSQFSGYPGEQIGMSVAGIGDLDGDGKSDLAVVGRVQASSGNQEAVFIHSTANGDLLRAYTSTPGDGFGYLVRGLGDLNADGAPEVAVVAPHRTTASSSLYHVEVDIISPAAAGDDRVRLKLADGEQCVIDVNVVGLNGVNYIDVVTMTVTAVYTHNLFDLSGVKIETEADTDVYRYGDVNKDNKIDQEDLWLVLNNMNTQAESGSPFQIDVNKDGLINESDLNDVVSASTNTPILKELSFFAQNRLQEMGEQFPVYFGITPETLQTVAEQRVNEKKDECKQCAQGQKKGCDDKCCGPGNWVWTRGVPTTTQTATVTGYNVTATSTTLSVPNAQNCQGSITLNDVMPSWTGLTINTSSTGAGTVAWNVTDTENWVGSGPACKRLVGAVISGTGALGVSLSTDPYPGNSASGSASGSSTGTGLGGSAAMPMTPISGSVSISQVAGSSALTLSLSASPSVSTAIPPGGGTPGNGQMGGSIGVTASAANNSTVTGTATLAVSGSFTVVGRYPADGTQICTDSAITDTNVGSLQCNDAAVGYQTGLSYGYKYARALVTASANMMITP